MRPKIRRKFYYPNFYPNYSYPRTDRPFFSVSGSGDNTKNEDVVKAIAVLIVDNRNELIKKLDELKIACSCGLHDAAEKDLSDIIIENIGNKKLREWIAEKIANKFEYNNGEGGGSSGWLGAITAAFQTTGVIVSGAQENKAIKGEYKNLIATEAIKYRAEQEKAIQRQKTIETLAIAGVSLAILGLGALFYFSSVKQQKNISPAIAG